jgi:macrolide transport system ATP-binding/permease protein
MTLLQDLRYAFRQLLKAPGFTLTAVLTLALGIGANTAIFTLVHAVLLKPLPFANPQQIYRIGDGDLCCEWGGLQDSWSIFDYPFYQHLTKSASAFEQIAAFSGSRSAMSIRRAGSDAAAQNTKSEFVSGNYFSTFGIQPAAGRLISAFDDQPAAPAVAVMSYRLWHENYASDPSIIGSTFTFNALPVTVVGIAAPQFYGDRLESNPADLWIPLHQEPVFEEQGDTTNLYTPGMSWLYLFGRLKPGMNPASVQTQLTLQLRQWLSSERSLSKTDLAKLPNQQIRLTPGGGGISQFRSRSRNGLYLLSIASMLVLLIACANLANLLLARSAARRQQTALRLSLGATRLRLIRAVLTESVLLSLIGGAVGLLLSYAGAKALLLMAFRGATYVPINASPSLPVLGFALLSSLITGVIFGVAPAWIGTHADPSEGLRGGTRSIGNQAIRPQKALVVVQAALSIVLLAVAGLVMQSLRNLENVDMGFETRGRLIASIDPLGAGYKPEQLPALYEQMQDRLSRIPGVQSASFSRFSPQDGCCMTMDISIGGRSESWIGNTDVISLRVSPHYFETIGTPVLRGRPITERDTPASPHVAVVDDAFARTFFPGEDPLGKRFGLSLSGHGYDYEIVGVVKDTMYQSPSSTHMPMYFVPFAQTIQYPQTGYARMETSTLYFRSIQLRVDGAPEGYESLLRRALAGINPDLSPTKVMTYSEQVAIQFNQQRLMARLTGLFSLLALLLASIGLYGVTAYNVARRTNEIGIRMALGADRGKVVSMVLRGAFSQIGLGLCIGIPLAMVCGRYLAHQLYGVGLFDPLVISGAAVALVFCALIAGLLPARRAASIEPSEALRAE